MDRLGLSRTEIRVDSAEIRTCLGIRAVPTARWASGQASSGGSLLEPLMVVEPRRLFQSSVGGNLRAVARPQPVSSALDRHPNIYMSSARPTPVGRARTLVLFVAGGCDLIAGGSRTYELTLVWRDQAAIMPPSLGCSPNEALMAGSHLLDDVERIAVRVAEAEHRWDTGEVEHLIVDIDAGGSKGRMVRFGIPR